MSNAAPATGRQTARLPIHEKVAYGLGNFMPTAVTATGGLAMYFYTDVAGLSAAFIGTMLLLVRVVDAMWDLWVGRRVDANDSRWGQCRGYLLWFSPLLALALFASFTIPPLEGAARTLWFVGTYIALWCTYSLVQIPFQSMLPVVAPDPDERLRVAGVSSLVQFVFVIACGAGFPIMKDILAAGHGQAHGFQQAALLMAVVGLLLSWTCFAFVRERVRPMPSAQPDLRGDLRTIGASRVWLIGFLVQVLLGTLVGLSLGSSVYYLANVLHHPELVGPYMGIGGVGLLAGVILSDQLTRRICKKKVLVGSMVACAVTALAFALVTPAHLPLVFVLAFANNVTIGICAPITSSMNGDIADQLELDGGRRVVGTLVATINFASKVGAGLCSALIGATLSMTGYLPGVTAQPGGALDGITALMSAVPAIIAMAIALAIARFYPLGRARLAQLRVDLEAARRLRAAA